VKSSKDWTPYACYHMPMLTDECMEGMQEQFLHLDEILESLKGELQQIRSESQIRTNEDPRACASASGSRADSLSIHYDFNAGHVKRVDRARYANVIGDDLDLRGLDAMSGSLKERRERLRLRLISEWSYFKLKEGLLYGVKGKDVALFLLIDAVPCILHLENRIGLKILTRLLTIGLSHALMGTTYRYDTEGVETSEAGRMKAYFAEVHRVVNCEILGTTASPAQWDCPRDDKKKEIAAITMDNVRTRKIIDGIEKLVVVCLPEPSESEDSPPGACSERAGWLKCIPSYREALIILRQKTDYTEDEISTFQKKIDIFANGWLELNGAQGMTNYIHMLASGHIAEYMRHWKNLYRHSQQGWEAFNSHFKSYFFRRTSRGGAGNKGLGVKSRLIPIARWLQRRMVWMSQASVEDMKAFYKEKG
jgi:hypothetical protein